MARSLDPSLFVDSPMWVHVRANRAAYAIEGAGTALLMAWLCAVAILQLHPGSPLVDLIPDPVERAILRALALALFSIAFVYSSWGQRSGAHLNPAVTLAYYVLGRVEPVDAVLYGLAQIAGGIVGVGLAVLVGDAWLAVPSVNYAASVPAAGAAAAFAVEALVMAALMTAVLIVANHRRSTRFTGLAAGVLVAIAAIFAAPLSGASFNPARGLATAMPAELWHGLWIYLTAPTLGALGAALLRRWIAGPDATYCAKLHHPATGPCHFRCRFAALMDEPR